MRRQMQVSPDIRYALYESISQMLSQNILVWNLAYWQLKLNSFCHKVVR